MLKCTKFDFSLDSAAELVGGAHSTPPEPSLDLTGDTQYSIKTVI